MDVTPPTDSDEVKAWIAAIDWSKVRFFFVLVLGSRVECAVAPLSSLLCCVRQGSSQGR